MQGWEHDWGMVHPRRDESGNRQKDKQILRFAKDDRKKSKCSRRSFGSLRSFRMTKVLAKSARR